jgi:hypothetical protein
MKRLGLAAIVFGIVACFGSVALAQGWGKVSDGSCGCKTRCDGGNSTFSPGRTLAQCRAMCAKAFSGCTRGEIRLPGRRDTAGAQPQRVAPSATAPTRAARTASAQPINSAAKQCLIEQGGGYDSYQGRVLMRTTERDAMVRHDAFRACVARRTGVAQRTVPVHSRPTYLPRATGSFARAP